MIVCPFRAWHLKDLRLQDAQAYIGPKLTAAFALELEEGAQGYSALLEDGAGLRPIACAGILPLWEGRALAWAFLSAEAGVHFRAIHRGVATFLAGCNVRRIEAYVDTEFEAGHRWMKMLGFQHEGRMRSFTLAGLDQDMYSRIKVTKDNEHG